MFFSFKLICPQANQNYIRVQSLTMEFDEEVPKSKSRSIVELHVIPHRKLPQSKIQRRDTIGISYSCSHYVQELMFEKLMFYLCKDEFWRNFTER